MQNMTKVKQKDRQRHSACDAKIATRTAEYKNRMHLYNDSYWLFVIIDSIP